MIKTAHESKCVIHVILKPGNKKIQTFYVRVFHHNIPIELQLSYTIRSAAPCSKPLDQFSVAGNRMILLNCVVPRTRGVPTRVCGERVFVAQVRAPFSGAQGPVLLGHKHSCNALSLCVYAGHPPLCRYKAQELGFNQGFRYSFDQRIVW